MYSNVITKPVLKTTYSPARIFIIPLLSCTVIIGFYGYDQILWQINVEIMHIY